MALLTEFMFMSLRRMASGDNTDRGEIDALRLLTSTTETVRPRNLPGATHLGKRASISRLAVRTHMIAAERVGQHSEKNHRPSKHQRKGYRRRLWSAASRSHVSTDSMSTTTQQGEESDILTQDLHVLQIRDDNAASIKVQLHVQDDVELEQSAARIRQDLLHILQDLHL